METSIYVSMDIPTPKIYDDKLKDIDHKLYMTCNKTIKIGIYSYDIEKN